MKKIVILLAVIAIIALSCGHPSVKSVDSNDSTKADTTQVDTLKK